ncbi:hypothetical protein M8R20_18990 [Pseudomonas sp. R2.Fl]|nr:hypothetical protein [Pseudomonas sp. R2.Fl]
MGIIARLAIAAIALAGMTLPATAASFDCDRMDLAPDEKAICDNRDLNDADVKMVTTFDLLAGLFAMGNRGHLQDEQIEWLKTRQACGADAECIRKVYDVRLKQLQAVYEGIERPL